MSSKKVGLATVLVTILLVILNVRAAFGLFGDTVVIGGNTFTTAASFGSDWYLHNNPTPPTGNTNSQTALPLNLTAPTAMTLYNYDQNRDSLAGLLIAKGGSAATETDTTKYQNWRTAALSSSLTINGNVSVQLWTAMKDFGPNKAGSIRAYLRHFNGSGYTEICNGTLTSSNWQGGSSSWVLKPISFTCSNYTIPSGHRLELKLIVTGSSDDDMWIAYDTTVYNSRVELP